jgi:CHRD domain
MVGYALAATARKERKQSMNSRFWISCTGLSLVALLSVTSIGFAEVVKLKADLKATEEVPPNDSTGTGVMEATYDSSSKQLSYTADYSGLTGAATMAHFHGPAEPGKNAPIVVPVQGSVASPIKGTATLTDAQAAELLSGKLYFNVHTEKNKGGEIRGQVTK